MRDWLAIRTAATPDTVALVDDETGRTWTYRDLDADVEVLARRLASAGVERGDRVGLLLDTRPAFVRLLWAVQRLGATLVPFNARLTPEEIAPQRAVVEPTVLVTDSGHEKNASEARGSVPVLTVDDPEAPTVTPLSSMAKTDVTPVDRSLEETQVVMFTSGTTGDPKPVRVTGQNFLASAVGSAFRLGVLPDDEWLLALPMYHMGGLSIPIRTTVYGTTTVLQREFEPTAVLETLRERPITGISLVPTMLRRLLETGDIDDSLRFALVGGGATSPDLARRALDADVPIHTTYGMTETASQITTASPADVAAHPETVGRPIGAVDVAILDAAGERVETGEHGEIAVRGWTVSPGYLDETPRGESTWFHTGDVGYRDESGRLYVTGRASERIVSGGENVAPEAVRRALVAHPGVTDAAVVGIPDEKWGERVGALVVSDVSLDRDALSAFLDERLAGFKRPRTVAFVDELPRTPSGTVDREAARAVLRDTES